MGMTEKWQSLYRPDEVLTTRGIVRRTLEETDYYSRGSQATDEQVSNLIEMQTNLICILHERGHITDGYIQQLTSKSYTPKE